MGSTDVPRQIVGVALHQVLFVVESVCRMWDHVLHLSQTSIAIYCNGQAVQLQTLPAEWWRAYQR
eukprot:5522443-Karenia_brevis.AAC.1